MNRYHITEPAYYFKKINGVWYQLEYNTWEFKPCVKHLNKLARIEYNYYDFLLKLITLLQHNKISHRILADFLSNTNPKELEKLYANYTIYYSNKDSLIPILFEDKGKFKNSPYNLHTTTHNINQYKPIIILDVIDSRHLTVVEKHILLKQLRGN